MSELPKIADSEWEIMKIIWKSPNITSTEIIKEVQNTKDWKASTIKTLINRLLKKEVISFNQHGKEYSYFPLVGEAQCVNEESENFINRVFNGSINSMLVNFVNSNKLTNDDLEELKSLLHKAKANED
ncbi:BlaI/MecI/CopY family transcriptional regulator [Clostridium culturomicium]|uniref:BlaI/MecI/CopY family transcriptional regulator n=1 Tax=Clostridium culturomicium TaxID=1499683 RepID=UPI00058C8152|nr:BlaI/MecI/CopY family transcriptional regulator [Clostridium culturomicium]